MDPYSQSAARTSSVARSHSVARTSSARAIASVAALSALLLFGLAACSNAENGETGSQGMTEETVVVVTETTTISPDGPESGSAGKDAEISLNTAALDQIDAQRFDSGDIQSFIYVNEGKSGECFISGAFVTCVGTADASVPEIEVPPFPKQPPSAILLGAVGAAYTMVEGVPPAEEELKPGQWSDFGSVQCGKPDEDSLVCESQAAAFAIDGAGRKIRTSGEVFDNAVEIVNQGS